MGNKKIKSEAREKISGAIKEAVFSLNTKAGEKLKKSIENSAKKLAVKYLKSLKQIEKSERKAAKKIAKKEKKATNAKLKAVKRADNVILPKEIKNPDNQVRTAKSEEAASARKRPIKLIPPIRQKPLEKPDTNQPESQE